LHHKEKWGNMLKNAPPWRGADVKKKLWAAPSPHSEKSKKDVATGSVRSDSQAQSIKVVKRLGGEQILERKRVGTEI